MTALHKAAEHIKPALDRWKIAVPRNDQAIYWEDEKIIVSREASRRECEAILKRVIKKANQKQFHETQERLL